MANLVTATTKCLIFQQQKLTLSLCYGTITWGDQLATKQQVDYTGVLSLCKGHCFVFTEIDPYSGYGFAFHAHNASAKTTITELRE